MHIVGDGDSYSPRHTVRTTQGQDPIWIKEK